jgi:N-acetyl-gamma-glutamyl-phosphate reductase
VVRVDEAGAAELLLHRHEVPHDDMSLSVHSSADGGQARLVARLDNLGKGASGAAVQNLNLMAGLPETAGLALPNI